MKTSKLSMIATAFAIAIMSLAVTVETKADKSPGAIYMSFSEAIQVPGIVMAMHQQLDNSFLGDGENQGYYTQVISYQGLTIYITGTYTQWYLFFRSVSVYEKKIDHNHR
jgi:hypothetical protein